MRWLRAHIGVGARLALLALTVQLVLSFGHVHVTKIAPSGASTISVAQLPNGDGAPGRHPHGGAGDFCAICATVSLVAHSVVPTAGAVALPVGTRHRWSVELAGTRVTFGPFIPFQARAPPRWS